MGLKTFVADAERQLAGHSQSVVDEFRSSLAELRPTKSDDEIRSWAEEGLALARHSLRSWEAAAEYYRVSPPVLQALSPAAFRRWVHAGR